MYIIFEAFVLLAPPLLVTPLAAITASSPLEYEATCLAHLSLGRFAGSSLQNL